MRALLGAAVALALVGAGCSTGTQRPPSPTPPPAPGGLAHLNVDTAFRSLHFASTAQQVESIAQVSATEYLMCDYYDVFRLDLAGSTAGVTRLARPAVSVWSPAGLAYSGGLLYVADNLGHDVLVLRVAGDGLQLVRQIARPGDQGLRTPRNVYVEPDGGVVVADYDGNAVVHFKGDGSMDWSVPMPGAGGVVEAGGFIYATSTGNHTVSKIDPLGHVIANAGAYGWSPGRFMFPIGLADDGAQLVVTDAVAGRAVTLDRDLHFTGEAGANGQGLDALDYPYATLPVSGGYVIADTFKNRLVLTDRKWTAKEQIAFGIFVPSGRLRPLVYGTDANPTSYAGLPGVDVLAELGLRPPTQFTGGFDGLQSGSGSVHQLNFDDTWVPVHFITWAQVIGSAIVVGSPQSSYLTVIDRASGVFAYIPVPLDMWWRNGSLLHSTNLRLDLASFIRDAVNNIAIVKREVAAGTPRQQAFEGTLIGRPYDWNAEVTSPAGQLFLGSGRTAADASRYYDTVLRQGTVRVTELLIVKYLSGR